MKWKNLLTQEVTEDINKTKPYRAKYPSVCSKCNQSISIGHCISWVRNGKGLKYHQNCSDPKTSPWILVDEHTWQDTSKSRPNLDETCTVCGERAGQHSAWDGNANTDGRCPINDTYDGKRVNWSINQFNKQVTKPEPTPMSSPAPIPEAFPNDKQFDMEMPDSPEFDNSFDREADKDTRKFEPRQASSSTGDGLLDLISSQVEAKVIDNVKRKVQASMDRIDASVKEKLDQLSIPTIILKRHELPDIKIHNVHKQFNDVLQLLNAGEYVYLHGAPGAGKSHLGPQLAEALGVRFGYMSLSEQTPEYVVKGFTSPIDGKYYGSQFVDYWTNGGLWCWSEMDLSNDNLRSSVNTMLEQKIAALDCGLVPMSSKFYMYADGNTCGRGAHPAFPSRTAFDAAFSARFVFLEFQYDWNLCKHIALGINTQSAPLVSWAESVSNWALANGVQLVMSPREVYKLAKLTALTTLSDDLLLDSILRGLDVPSKEKLLSNYPFPHITR